MSESSGIVCPQCGGPMGVIDSRRHDGYVRRRRRCQACGRRLTTFEKRPGQRVPADAIAAMIDDLPLSARLDLLQRLADSISSELGAADC